MLNGKKAIIIICILGVVLSAALSGLYFRFSYFEPDTVSYLFQAKLFAHGRLSMPQPPEFGFSSSPHINIHNGKWYSKYPFGNALMLTLGVFVGAPWLIPALLTGFALLLLYLIVREVYGHRIALLAAFLGLISPSTLGMGSTWFSEPVSRFYLAIYLLALIRTLKGGRWFYPAISGFALGYAFNTRPIPAVAFGLAGAGLTIYWLGRNKEKIALLKKMTIFLIPFAVMMAVCLAWNTHFTGNPLKFTHNVAQPYDKMGFGKRTESYEPDLENAFIFTPKWAFERIWRHTIPCISFNTLGWGYYRPNLFRWGNKELLSLLRAIPLIFPLILMLIPIFQKDRNRYDFLFLAFLVLNLLFYFFFYFEGSTWGITPVNARYYTECTLLGIIPLVARGMFILYGLVRRLRSKLQETTHDFVLAPTILLVLVLAFLTFNTVHSYVLIGKPYRNWGAVYQKLPRLVKQQEIHRAVIFIPNHRGAPIGDYPFQSLEEADIIYFKLGPSKAWKLTNSDWRNVYDQYFKGRRAYLYQNGQLKPLVETDIIP